MRPQRTDTHTHTCPRTDGATFGRALRRNMQTHMHTHTHTHAHTQVGGLMAQPSGELYGERVLEVCTTFASAHFQRGDNWLFRKMSIGDVVLVTKVLYLFIFTFFFLVLQRRHLAALENID